MKSGSTFDTRFAAAGLLAGVGLEWALLVVGGSLDGAWLLAGFMAMGLGVLLIKLIDGVSDKLFSPPGRKEDDASGVAAGEGEAAPEPRLRVFVISSVMQGVSLGFLAAYFSDSVAVGVFIGLLVGTLALAVSTLLARRLSPTGEDEGGARSRV